MWSFVLKSLVCAVRYSFSIISLLWSVRCWTEIDALLRFSNTLKCLSSETLLESTFKVSSYQLTLTFIFKIRNNNSYCVGHLLVLKNEAALITTEENEWEILGVKRRCVGGARERPTNYWNCRSKNECYDHWSAMHFWVDSKGPSALIPAFIRKGGSRGCYLSAWSDGEAGERGKSVG